MEMGGACGARSWLVDVWVMHGMVMDETLHVFPGGGVVKLLRVGVRPTSTHHQPMGHNPPGPRTPPPWLTRRITPTQARKGRHRYGANLKPARSQRPGKPHPTHPSARPAGKHRPADTTPPKTISMPSWSPA